MKNLFKIVVIICFFALTLASFAKDDIPIEIQKKLQENMMLGSTALGYEFYIAIPPNEMPNYPCGALEIYVASTKPTKVTLQVGSTNSTISQKFIDVPMGIVIFSSRTGELSCSGNEVRIPETVLDMGLRLISNKNPVSVYVLNSKSETSDGYMAIPVSSWGNDYIHIGYYDSRLDDYIFGSGFVVIASANNTRVAIDLIGRGEDSATTTSGNKIGEQFEILLNSGQVFLVQGDGKTAGYFDLTGTSIKSDKPIGLISYHQRCNIPALLKLGPNHLCEMIPPVQAWGKTYATVELNRKSKGDLFRIVASEPNTKWELIWYDMLSGDVLGQRDGTLKKSGDFAEILDTQEMTNDDIKDIKSVRGISMFKADKPIFVMHYSFSEHWDDTGCDPFMVCVTSVEQFAKATVFQTPVMQFSQNNFNILAVGDPDNYTNNEKLLKSIRIDDDFVYAKAPQFLQSRIPGTNLYWARMELLKGAHFITGDTPFGGYIYGYSHGDGYGWPAAMEVKNLSQLDTLPPVVTIAGTCGEYDVHYTELRNGRDSDNPRQVDMGVSEQPTLIEPSVNFDEPVFEPDFVPYPFNYDSGFKLRVSDLSKDALAVFAITDRAGNTTVRQIEYKAAHFELDPSLVDFDTTRVNSFKEISALLKNIGTSPSEVLSVELKNGSVFSIVEKPTLPFEVKNGESLPLNIRYSPTKESLSVLQYDMDSIIVTTECSRFAFPVKGRGVIPKIQVADWDAGQLDVGKEKCLYSGLEIKNPGTQTLVVTGFDWEPADAAFTISDPTVPEFPFSIEPGQSIKIKLVCFKPLNGNPTFTATLKFKSNAETGDSLGILTGRSISPGPQITDFDWSRRRVLDPTVQNYYPGYVIISNSGTSSIKLKEVKLMLNSTTQYIGTDFKIVDVKSENTNETLTPGGQIEIFPASDTDINHSKSVRVNLLYSPLNESADRKIEIHANFENIAQGSVFGLLQGEPFLPYITADGYKFVPEVQVGQQHPNEGVVIIQSTSQTADLFIKEIRIIDDIVPNSKPDFDLNGDLTAELAKYKNFTLQKGAVISIPVHFKPTQTGRRAIHLEIVSDAYKALDSIQSSFVIIEGGAIDQSFNATNIDFGRITRCESPVMTFDVINSGTTNKLKILSIKVENAYKDIFIIEDFTAGEEINPASKKTYHVRFEPTAQIGQIHDNNGNVSANVNIETEMGTKTVKFEGRSVKSLVKLSQPILTKMTAGMSTTSQYQEFPVSIELNPNDSYSGNWNDTKINSLSVEIKYNPAWMKYNGSITAGDVGNGWTFYGKETIHSETSATLTVTGSGTNPIIGNGKLFNPDFLIMLSDSINFSPQFGVVSFDGRDLCVESINEPGSIELEHCVRDLRHIIINKNQFNLAPISPNPITSGSVNVNFSIGLNNVYTKIELINSMGEVVRILQDGEMNSGAYQAVILTSELGSGIYFINMQSGDYLGKEKLVIMK